MSKMKMREFISELPKLYSTKMMQEFEERKQLDTNAYDVFSKIVKRTFDIQGVGVVGLKHIFKLMKENNLSFKDEMKIKQYTTGHNDSVEDVIIAIMNVKTEDGKLIHTSKAWNAVKEAIGKIKLED